MEFDKIVCLANKNVRLQFLAMERSLRATGCQLPLWVIPYDENIFELPANAHWWVSPDFANWLAAEQAPRIARKYQCLTIGRYQYVDADVCFLRNPEEALESYKGFIVCDTDWNKPGETFTKKSRDFMAPHCSTWQKSVFNAGQFACDVALFQCEAELKAAALRPTFKEVCLRVPPGGHDQPGMNLLVFDSGIQVTNLTLPPVNMESTWAGDYPGEYEPLWQDSRRKPYLIHWAGGKVGESILLSNSLVINEIFHSFLTCAERQEWDEKMNRLRRRHQSHERSRALMQAGPQFLRSVKRRFSASR